MSNSLVLTLNCGSSSLKFSVINPEKDKTILLGIVDFLCISNIRVSWTIGTKKYSSFLNKTANYKEIINFISKKILQSNLEIFSNIVCIGHRVVHGGSKIKKSVVVNEKIMAYIQKMSLFAPLHNPINLLGIQASFSSFPHLKKKI